MLVTILSRNLVPAQQPALKCPPRFEQECQSLSEVARLLGQYNSVWVLTQSLFHKLSSPSIQEPRDAIQSASDKFGEQQKLLVVKQVLLETQQVQSAMPTSAQPTHASVALISATKRLLDALEQTNLLFGPTRVPCMHMCIWAVTSILKMFEKKPELFLQVQGPPPPPSDSESNPDAQESSLGFVRADGVSGDEGADSLEEEGEEE